MARMLIHSAAPWSGVVDLKYDAQNFRDLYDTELGKALWDWLRRLDNLVRMETATYLGRSAVEPLAPYLVYEFGGDIEDDRTKQMIGHMARQILEALDFSLARKGMRITMGGLFTTAAKYEDPNDPRNRTMSISADQRQAWLQKTAHSPFNRWLDAQVKDPSGKLNLDRLYDLAAKYKITNRYEKLNPGQIRMNIGNALRRQVPASLYSDDEGK